MLTNCTNCGAPLQFTEKDYGKLAKCSYCDTEYHLDMLGRIEEYKVKLKVMGEVRQFYINEVACEPVCMPEFRNLDGTVDRTISFGRAKLKLKLIEF